LRWLERSFSISVARQKMPAVEVAYSIVAGRTSMPPFQHRLSLSELRMRMAVETIGQSPEPMKWNDRFAQQRHRAGSVFDILAVYLDQF